MDKTIVDIYKEFTNGYLNRRVFLKKLAFFTGGTAAAYTILSQLENNAAMAEVVAKDDPRLHTEYINYPGETGEVLAYAAQPKGQAMIPGVIVIHENKGLQPHIEDVTRRVALKGFMAIAPDWLLLQTHYHRWVERLKMSIRLNRLCNNSTARLRSRIM